MTNEQRTRSSGSAPTSSDMREELSNDASRLKDTAENRARQEAKTRKNEAARVAGSASSAFETAASELESDDNAPEWLGSAMRQAAGGIDRLAGQLDGRSVNEIGQEVAGFARSNPGTFLAASAAAGFAAARVLRAGAEHKQHDEGSQASGDAYTAPRGTTATAYGSTSAQPSTPIRTREGATL